MPSALPRLPIDDMADRHAGLTRSVADANTEAATVCLDRHHSSLVEFTLATPSGDTPSLVEWEPASPRTRGAWANDTDATEAGACAVALAAVELVMDLVAVRRAETETGADYYVAPTGTTTDDMEEWYRLEVSGISAGSSGKVRQRLREKVAQAKRGNSDLPALAGVVGFYARRVQMSDILDRSEP